MEIGHFQKQSFIDYPGMIGCVLFTIGCNFKCPYCHNPALVNCNKECVDSDEVFGYLGYHHPIIDGVVISGGEPTLHKDLYDVCYKFKSNGYPVKLDTNGSRPDVLWRLIKDNLVDYIAMDIKTTPDKYQQFVGYSGARIPDSVKMIIGSGIRHEFRSTCVKPMVDGNIEDIGKLIQGADLYVLQNMRLDVMLDTNFIKDDNQIYTDQDLQGLKMIISPYVKKCIVR